MLRILGSVVRTVTPVFNKAGTNTVPTAPVIGTASVSGVGASIAFTPPSSSGGTPITRYTATATPGGATADGTASPIVITPISTGIAYTFKVTATNAIGEGPPSAASNSLTRTALPGAPTAVVATPGNVQLSVAFVAPADNGGAAITQYTATTSPGGFTGSGASSPVIVTGLTNGASYTVTVTATNAVGVGPASSASAAATPRTVPGAPTIGTPTRGNTQVSVAFSAPGSNGGSAITGYTATSSPGGFTASGSGSPLVVTGLSNGTSYTFTVVATNIAGNSAPSAASAAATPATVPGAPTIGAATSGNAQVSVAFTPPSSNGGEAITQYTATSTPGGFTGSGASSPVVVTGLTNGTSYTFTVTATNAVGTGAASGATAATTPATVPGAPTIGTATAGVASATVAYSAPSSNGGDAITGYTATSSPGGLTGTGTTSPISVSGLTNGVAYTFTVTATNTVGTGSASAASNSVTPAASITPPGAPTIGTAARSASQTCTVAFTAPASDGGSAITSYVATSTPGSITASGSSSPVTVPGLTNGTSYTFKVHAINAAGAGAQSAASNAAIPATVPTVPGVPFVTTTASGTATILVGYPASTGGSAITNYRFTASPGGATLTKTAAEVDTDTTTFTGLTDGVAYTFTAIAINVYGDSPASAASNSVIPGGIPGPFDAYYGPTWTPVTALTTLSTQTLALPAVATGRATASYIDARFNTRVYRVVSTTTGEWTGTTKVRHDYPRTQAFNSDGSIYIAIGGGSRYYLFNTATFARILGGKTDITPSGAVGINSIFPQSGEDVSWHPTDPNILRFITSKNAAIGLRMYEYSVSDKTVTLMRNLEGRLAAHGMGTASSVTSASEGRPSDNGRYYCLMVKNGSTHLGYICYDWDTDTIVGSLVTSTTANNTSMSSLGNYCIISNSYSGGFAAAAAGAAGTPRGIRAYNRTFSTFNQLGDTSLHGDVCIDAAGDEAYIGYAGQYFEQLAWGSIYLRKCASGTPTQLYLRNSSAGTCTQMHFSGCGTNRPGWAVISTFHDLTTTETGWIDYSMFAVKLHYGALEVRRIAHHRGGQIGTANYWYQGHATVSRDGLQVLFATGFRETYPASAWMHVPADYLVGLPSWFYGAAAGSGEWGNNVVDNGSFTTGMAPWTIAAGAWTWVSAGTCMQVTAPDSTLTQALDLPLTVGVQYRITFDVFGYSATGSGVRAQLGGGTTVQGALFTTNGPKTVTLTAVSGNNAIQFNSASDFSGSAKINNVVVIPV